MSWQIVQKSAYLSDFVELKKNLQQAVIKAVKELEQDPITPRGDTNKKLGGCDIVWCDLRLCARMDKADALAMGVDFAAGAVEVYEELLPLYEASVP